MDVNALAAVAAVEPGVEDRTLETGADDMTLETGARCGVKEEDQELDPGRLSPKAGRAYAVRMGTDPLKP
ncbi:MAG: hypothetical protein WBQ10_11485 [Terriglobales bacterium]